MDNYLYQNEALKFLDILCYKSWYNKLYEKYQSSKNTWFERITFKLKHNRFDSWVWLEMDYLKYRCVSVVGPLQLLTLLS